MILNDRTRIALGAALLFPWTLASAQEAIDPEAIAALDKMGAFLRSLERFEVHADTTIDEVLEDSGQKIQLARNITYRVQRPDRLFVDLASDRKQRQLYYDGQSITVFAPRLNYYASVDAPPTIAETLSAAEARHGLTMPLRDLFVWGTEQASIDAITTALDIGPSTIDGELCDHYAYRQDDIDWQLWVRQGEQPLPCKLVITTTSEETQPQYSAVLSWTLEPAFDEETFTFQPQEDTQRIVFARPQAEETGDTEESGN